MIGLRKLVNDARLKHGKLINEKCRKRLLKSLTKLIDPIETAEGELSLCYKNGIGCTI